MNVDHIAIRVADLDKMQKWYENHVGAVLIFKDRYYRRMKMENTTIALIDEKRYPHNHIGFLVNKQEELPVVGVRTSHRDGTIGVYQQDPEGNTVEYIWYSKKTGSNMNNAHKQQGFRGRVLQKIQYWGSRFLG
jgi:catechol-2,3-dioxygenase